MFPVDLYLLSKTKPLDNENFNKYYKTISKSENDFSIREYERVGLYKLVDLLKLNPTNPNNLKGFYYSYTIEQIGKEFDLLKIFESFVLNIEIKSQMVDFEKIKTQLVLNRHYLKNIRSKVISFTYISNENRFFTLSENNELNEISCNELINLTNNKENYINSDISDIMLPSKYLVSPFNDIDKFLNNEYFLTQQQEEIKTIILNDIKKEHYYNFYKILGNAGTGKTLLIYDIAKELSSEFKICIIHCANLNKGQNRLNNELNNIKIVPVKILKNNGLPDCDIVIVDESQRIYESQYNNLIKDVMDNNKKIIFSIGTDQLMQESEIEAAINDKIDLLDKLLKFQLSDKIRTNKNLSAFIANMVNLEKMSTTANYEKVNIYYVSTKAEAKELVRYFVDNEYKYISLTPSSVYITEMNDLENDTNTHAVIGQEFDKVVMIMGADFEYVGNRLNSKKHPNPNYISSKLFYQGITRARTHLSIVVLRNPNLYQQLIKIKQNKRSNNE